jgi:hypothetical protein
MFLKMFRTIAKNHFSVSKGASFGNVFQFENNFCIIKNDQKKAAGIGLDDNQLYRLNSTVKLYRVKINQVVVVLERKTYIKVTQVTVCDAHENAQIVEPHVRVGINLWHQRLGHLGVDNMKLLVWKNVMEGLIMRLNANLTFYEGFFYGKQHKEQFPIEGASWVSKLLRLVHSNIWGLIKVPISIRAKYFVTFINDYFQKNILLFFEE